MTYSRTPKNNNLFFVLYGSFSFPNDCGRHLICCSAVGIKVIGINASL